MEPRRPKPDPKPPETPYDDDRELPGDDDFDDDDGDDLGRVGRPLGAIGGTKRPGGVL